MKNKPAPRKQEVSKREPVKAGTLKKTSDTMLDSMEKWFEKNSTVVFSVILLTGLIFSLLLFDVKMSEGNDDSDYLEGAYRMAHDFSNLFNSKAPLYPMIMSIPVKLFGLNVILLKFSSVIFSLLHLTVLFFAFRKKVPYVVFFPVMLFVAINSYFLYFASQTYTESMFLLMQALFVYCFVKIFDAEQKNSSLKNTWKLWLLMGFMMLVLSLTKNIAIGAVIVLMTYFLFNRKFLQMAYAAGAFLVFRIPFEIIKKLIWTDQSQFANQMNILTQKDPYDKSKGMEDFNGFVQRFFDNTNIYVSKRLFQILGFRSIDETTTVGGLVFIFLVFCGIGIYWSIKNKQKVVQFLLIYSFIMSALTFIVLQTRWDQPRMIMVYTHFFLLLIFFGLYSIVKSRNSFLQFFYLLFIGIILSSSLIATLGKSAKKYPIVKKNLAGDIYYGYTPDWVNFLKLSAWCADSLPESTYAASRKAPMSFIYARGKEFFPVYNVVSMNADSVIDMFKQNKVTHVMLASLRRNPKKQDGYIINTMHRMMQPVIQKYPDKLRLVKQMGDSEAAYLYEIKY